MNNYSFKSRYLRVMLLSLLFLMTAGQLNAKTIYFKNTLPGGAGNVTSWTTPHIVYWGGDNGQSWPGKAMTNLGDGWWSADIGNNTYCLFADGNSNAKQQTVNQTPGSNNAFTPTRRKDDNQIEGDWGTYVETTWTIVGDAAIVNGDAWDANNTDNDMLKGADGTYTLTVEKANLAAGDYYYKVVKSHDYSQGEFPSGYNNNKLTISETGDYTIVYTYNGASNLTATAKRINNIISLRGEFNGWSPDENVFTKSGDSNIYTTTASMNAGQKFKLVVNGNWYGYTEDNIIVDGSPVKFEGNKGDAQLNKNVTNATFTFNLDDYTLTVTEPLAITKVAIFGGLTGSSWSTTETELTEVSEGVYTYQFTAPEGSNKHWVYKVYTNKGEKYFAPNGEAVNVELNSETGADGSLMDNRGNNSYKCEDIQSDAKYLVTMKLNADGTGKVTIKRIGGITTNDIPVYPRGVQSETELAAYDFASNNVVYLLAEVLNHERISPEWQMTKGADGKYHLDGFAMRTTNCHTHKGDKTEEKTVFVRKFTAIDSHEDVGGTTVDLGDVHLSEGKLYNAVFDAQSNVLTLTEDESANGRMPFISLVGNEMKQNQNYDTPRGRQSDDGWQEAWLQYDENGKLLKDRKGNVMYSTMWPPKNPIYFTANIGGERLYSSEQMAFKAQNNYVAKKGSVWKTELQAAENGEAYNHLDAGDFKLEDDVEYVRYVVPDIWYVGAAKIWTGWTGRTNDNGDAQWSNHRNWGYGNKELGSGDAGTPVEAEMPYYLSTEKDHNGNFYFEKPTYFKTIEFFYNTSDYNKSRLYTTLAFGNAQIEAQSHNNGSTYDYGQYKPSVKPGEGVSVSSYIIRCYDAATGKLVTLNNGIVAQGEGNPSATAFQDAQAGLAEGKYYFEMEVVFNIDGTDKQRTTTVKSNPFVVHFPGVYTVEPVAQQLAQMGTNPNGYVSYSTGNEAIYHVNLNAAGEIESMAVVSESERAELYNNYFGKNQGINWSDKVLVVAPVPAQFKRDAEKADATVSIEGISNYTVTDNGAQKTATKRADGSMALLSSVKNFDSKAFNAVMNYVETVEGSDYNKESKGKATSVEMMRPNPKAEVAGVTVEKVANTAPITVDGREVAANYYKVNVDLNFGNANVTANSEQPAFEVFNGTTSKLYTAEAGKSYFTLSYAAVDPTEFNAANIEVVARYKDKNGNYSLAANIGDPVVANELVKGFEKKAVTTISSFELANVKVKNEDGNHNMYVTQLATETTHNDQINGYDLDAEQYKMRYEFDNADSNLEMDRFFNTEDLDVNVDVSQIFDPENAIFVTKFVGGYLPSQATIYLAPVYPVLVDGRMTVQNLVDVTNGIAGAPALKANSERYIALYGNEAEKSMVKDTGIVTGIDGISASKAVSSVRFVNVAGQMSNKPFEGMNIMVTTYTDGTTSTAKVIK